MHNQVVEKIKNLRESKNIKPKEMADKLNISLSAYNKLEAGVTSNWAKYLDEILEELDITIQEFFKDITTNYSIINKRGSYGGNVSMHVENLYAENKDKTAQIEQLFTERLEDKDKIIHLEKEIIKELREVIELKNQIIASLNK